MTAPRLLLSGITKRYGSLAANADIDLQVAPGEIHAVLGENGAGKSTLMKIIYGAVQPDAGHMEIDGQALGAHDPRAARARGVAMVFQHFSLFDTLTVAENVWLGLDGQDDLATVSRRVAEVGERYGLPLDPARAVHTLSVGERQRVEIIRALLTNPQLLILDEPTSVLTPQAVERLFVTLRQLAAEGCSILYISHKLHEIQALCDACTILRGGRVTGRVDPRSETTAGLSRLMIGAEPPVLEHHERVAGEVALAVSGLNLPAAGPFGVALQNIHLAVRAGEIVGIAGVSGNGQAELLAALSGEQPLPRELGAERICVQGQGVAHLGPQQRRVAGLGFVPEERLGRGAVPTLGLSANLLLTRRSPQTLLEGWVGWVRWGEVRRLAAEVIQRFGVKAAGPEAAARSLSGGNLQKFIMGREIGSQPAVLVVAQPTWGVDVGASAQIHQALLALRDAGCAVLVVSEELDELFALTDRLHVMAGGRLSPSIATREASTEQIGQWMSGLWEPAQAAHMKEGADAAA
jgi:ABC-type uncharacterized transport system ATPase subunit